MKKRLAANAKAAILIQISPKYKIFFKKHINKKLHPASLTKLMTMLIVLECIDSGDVNWSDPVEISKTAASTVGSKLHINAGEKYSLENLFKAMIIASGNDAAVAIAEFISGSENNFVCEMERKANKLKLTRTNFVNPHGLSIDNHYSSVNDIAKIALELLKRGEVLRFSSLKYDYLFDEKCQGKKINNTNKLVGRKPYIDGLKTGNTKLAGYCLAATARKEENRVLAIVLGEPNDKTRDDEIIEMIKYSFKLIKRRSRKLYLFSRWLYPYKKIIKK